MKDKCIMTDEMLMFFFEETNLSYVSGKTHILQEWDESELFKFPALYIIVKSSLTYFMLLGRACPELTG